MLINYAPVFWFASNFACSAAGEERFYDLFAQKMNGSHSSEAVFGSFVAARALDLSDKAFGPELLGVIGGVAHRVRGAHDLGYLCSQFSQGEAFWDWCQGDGRGHHSPHSGFVDIDSSHASGANHRGKRQPVQGSIINEGCIYASQNAHKAHDDGFERGHDFREAVHSYAATQFSCIMDDGFDAKDALAFAVDLGGELSEVQLKDRQIPDRFLDHVLQPSFGILLLGRAMPIPEDRPDGFNAQRGADPINDSIENVIQITAPMEKEILAVLRLIDRITVMESAALLFFGGQGEAQAS